MKNTKSVTEVKKTKDETIWELRGEIIRLKKLLERERTRRKKAEDEFRRSIPVW